MTRIEKILSSGVIKASTFPFFSFDITHFRFFTFNGVDDKGEYLLIGNIAEDISEKNAIFNGKKCSVIDLDLFADNKLEEHLELFHSF